MNLTNNFTISLLESAGFIALLTACLQIAIIILTTKGVEETGYKVMPIMAGFGWFGYPLFGVAALSALD